MKKYLKVFMCLFMVLMPVVSGAASNGCDDPNNEYIAPELALCSTHVYNIGLTDNPTNDTERGYMKDMVALKATIMTQQLNKQYEYLESMIRRFKTQLEKAILATRLQTSGAGGASSGGSSSFKSDDRDVHLAEVTNCLNVYQDEKKLKCYEDNLNVIINVSNNGDKVDSNLKKQLWFDFRYLAELKFGEAAAGCDVKSECKDTNKDMTKKEFQSCLNDMRSCLYNQYSNYNNQQLKLKK